MINVLDQATIDKIAAGEVIERPASIVKELVENSIDAGASRITIEIKDGGKELIRVTDNGSGIDAGEVRTAFLSHATSKLRSAKDLEAIGTLGFRGEALSTISAVTKAEIITKTPSAMTGVRYQIHGGKEIGLREVGAPTGTTILAENIFYNTPARLKFLKTSMTEAGYISDLLSHMALSEPDVAIRLINNGKTIIDTTGSGKLKETIFSLYGKNITENLLEVNGELHGIKVYGYSGKPFLSKGNRSFENYFVNKRYIKSAVINRAIEEAYKTYVMQHKFPFTVLFIEMPAENVDVNVHPAKREFRCDREKELFSAVFHAVQDSLKEKELIPDAEKDYGQRQKSFTPLKAPTTPNTEIKSSPERSSFNPLTGSVNREKSFKASELSSSKPSFEESKPSFEESKPSFEASKPYPKSASTSNSSSFTSSSFSSSSSGKSYSFGKTSSGEKDGFSVLGSILPDSYMEKLNAITGKTSTDAEDTASTDNMEEATSTGTLEEATSAGTLEETTSTDEVEESPVYKANAQPNSGTFTSKTEQLSVFMDEPLSSKNIRIIGEVFDTYWMGEYNGELYLMDQHAAHEKINYETFLAEFKARKIYSQQVFPPDIVTLSAREKAAVLENKDRLLEVGFEIDDYGDNDIRISSVPANLVGLNGHDVFIEFAAYLATGVSGVTEDIFVHKLATMGCKAAIKGNQKVSLEEAKVLFDKIFTLDNPYTCPHGRPTIIRISKADLEKKFKRIVD